MLSPRVREQIVHIRVERIRYEETRGRPSGDRHSARGAREHVCLLGAVADAEPGDDERLARDASQLISVESRAHFRLVLELPAARLESREELGDSLNANSSKGSWRPRTTGVASSHPETGDLLVPVQLVAGARNQHYLQLWRSAA